MKRKSFNQNPIPFAQAILHAQGQRAEQNPAHAKKHARMHECFSSWMARQLDGTSGPHSHRHCKDKTCTPCRERRIAELMAEIVETYKEVRTRSAEAHPVFLVFRGPSFPLHDAAECVATALSHWGRFAGSRFGLHLLDGYVRGVEIDVDHDAKTVSALVSAIVMVRDRRRVTNFGGWLALWSRYAQGAEWQLEYQATPNPDAIHTDIALRAFAERVGTFAVRPENLCEEREAKIVCDVDKLQTLDEATTNRRFICFGGSMSN